MYVVLRYQLPEVGPCVLHRYFVPHMRVNAHNAREKTVNGEDGLW
jgi:hypothetical protein